MRLAITEGEHTRDVVSHEPTSTKCKGRFRKDQFYYDFCSRCKLSADLDNKYMKEIELEKKLKSLLSSLFVARNNAFLSL
jgi:hypothetical protein